MDAMNAGAPAAVTAALIGAAAAATDPAYAAAAAAAEAASEREYVAQMYEELTQELIAAEQEIIAEFEARQRQDTQAAAAHLAAATSEGVFCPVCCKAYLFQHMNVIFCNCGQRSCFADVSVFCSRHSVQITDRCTSAPPITPLRWLTPASTNC
jgi:hypothetical protein